ncbi:FecR family protein [Algihabitans sp.]|uniref:FecR family protein n=1 Tax=Algihabitans sp. TaxID=2821514 RepID=UPI003BAAD938
MNEADREQKEIYAVAADWAARLGGDPLNAAERRELDLWLDGSARHRAAFEEATSAWEAMGELRSAPGALVKDIVPAREPTPAPVARSAASSPIGSPVESAVVEPGRKGRRGWRQAFAIAACLLLLVGGTGLWFGDPSTVWTADHRTAPGQRERIALSDGSTVELGPASAIAVRYGERERKVELLAGLAFFTAATMDEGERRPFVVAAAQGRAQALGTRFTVARLADVTEVVVIEHEVEVTTGADGGQAERAVVPPGSALRYAGSRLGELRPVNLDQATAWRRDRLIADSVTLAEVVAQLNRYRRGRIVIADPALASRRISGLFDMTDPEAALALIARDLQIRTLSLPPLVTLLY